MIAALLLSPLLATTPSQAGPTELRLHEETLRLEPRSTAPALQSAEAGSHVGARRQELGWAAHPAVEVHFLPVPGGAELLSCEASRGGEALPLVRRDDGCTVLLAPSDLDEEVALSWSWRAPGLPTQGTWTPHQDLPVELARLVVTVDDGAGLDGEVAGAASGRVRAEALEGGGLRFLAEDLPPGTPEGLPDGLGTWTLARVGERAVLPDPAAVEADLAFYAILASLPEPAVSMRHKNRAFEEAVLVEVLDELKARVRPGSWPGQANLRPRKLLRGVRRSGWGGPWELALYGARLLKQLKEEGRPLPLRPAPLGEVAWPAPEALPEAVLRWDRGPDDPVYVDLSCRQCALGEIRAELWGGQVLDGELRSLPGPPPGLHREELRLSADGRAARRVVLEGPPALALREALSALPAAARAEAVAARLGAAELVSQEGIGERGAPVRLALREADATLPPLDRPLVTLPTVAEEGEERVWLGAPGRQVRVVEGEGPPPAGLGPEVTLEVEHGGLRWIRTVTRREGGWQLEETLFQAGAVHQRAEVLRFLEAVEAALDGVPGG